MAERINERDAIKNLQTYLRRIAYFDGEINAVPIDGIYAEETRLAVTELQRSHGLPATGVVDRATWDLIFGLYSELTREKSPPTMISPFPQNPDGYELSLGDTQFLVDIVQYILGELSVDYDGFDNVVRNGTFDQATERAVAEFQRINGITITGRVDRITWNALAAQYNYISLDYRQ